MKINANTIVVIGVAAYGANKAAQFLTKNEDVIKTAVADFVVKKVNKVILGDDTRPVRPTYNRPAYTYTNYAKPAPKYVWSNAEELLTAIKGVIPTASLGYDNEGQVVIYTDLGGSDSGVIRQRAEQ